MDYKDITAEWARETSQGVRNSIIRDEVEKMLDIIEQYARDGESIIEKAMSLEIETVLELRQRGFDVAQTDEQRDGYWLVIKW